MKKCLAFLSLLSIQSSLLFGQERALFSWNHDPSFNDIQMIVGDDEVIFAGSSYGLFSYQEGQPINFINREKGLSGVNFGTIEYLNDSQKLLIGYDNGKIDLVSSSGVQTDNGLARLDARLSKKIYDHCHINERAFFASDLGVIEYLIDQASIRDVFQNIGPNASPAACYQVISDDEFVYAFCDQGLLKGHLSKNLLDFTQWEMLLNTSFDDHTRATILNSNLYFSQGDENLFLISSDGVMLDTIQCFQPITHLQSMSNSLFVSAGNLLLEVLPNGSTAIRESTENEIIGFLFTSQRLWLAEKEKGIRNQISINSIIPSGPHVDQPTNISSVGSKIYLFGENAQYSIYDDKSWSMFDSNSSILVDAIEINGRIQLLSSDNRLFDETLTDWSNLGVVNGAANGIIQFENQFWITSQGSSTPLIYSEDLINWTSISASVLGTASLSNPQYSTGGTFYFFNENEQLFAFEPISESKRILGSTAGISSTINDYRVDQDDRLFVATDQGLYYSPDATFIFNSEPLSQAYIEGGRLLSIDPMTALEIDAGNRKWIATTKGLWLYNASLTREIAFYSEENSLLPSNKIRNLTFQPTTGLLWVNTDAGIASLQTDAILSQFEYKNIKIFPNPLSLSTNLSQIGISGLYHDATLKITSISGNFIAEIKANGSMASWDLTSYGSIVSPGIYLFFSSDEDGRETYVGKVLIEP